MDQNTALSADVEVGGGVVTVTTAITFPTFFGSVLGRPQMTAVATAAAGCFVPSAATGILPIAWACKPPFEVEPVDWADTSCEIQYADLDVGTKPIYVIMDAASASQDYYCFDPPNQTVTPPGGVDCDIDNDGTDDLLGTGGRSWLDLDGTGGGAFDLSCWIDGNYASCPIEIPEHSWRSEQDGVANSVFMTAGENAGEDRIMPVFDYICRTSENPLCPQPWHTEDNSPGGGGTSAIWYHIKSFSIFHITCVTTVGKVYDPEGTGCPGNSWAQMVTGDHNVRTIEGYFMEGYVPGLEGKLSEGGTYAGAFTIYLIK
jgi:hypothetical protein